MSGRLLRFPGGEGSGAVGDDLVAAVEALLFAAGEPVSVAELCEALDGALPDDVRAALLALQTGLSGRGIELVEVSSAWQLRTRSAYGTAVLRLRGGRPARLGRAALEALAIVAWKQPATRQDVEEVRGVDSGAALKGLLERGLVEVRGRRDIPGRPLEYGTTGAFLEMFGLPSLAALPSLRDREELLGSGTPDGEKD